MVFNLRMSASGSPLPVPTRWFAGLSVSNDANRIDAALVGIHGQGSGAPLEIRKTMSFDLPGEVVAQYDELLEESAREDEGERGAITCRDGFSRTFSSDIRHRLLREMCVIEEEAFSELVAESGVALPEILAVGVNDPGIRSYSASGQQFTTLCEPESLAQRTGMNIIDAFPRRDIATAGQGGPVFAFPTWILLKSETRDRILIDLGKTAKVTWIPRTSRLSAAREITYREVAPCGLLLDALTHQLTKGAARVDTGGRLTVQGCHIPPLLKQWKELAAREQAWNPYGISPIPYLHGALGKPDSTWAVRDILCTATHLIADAVAETALELIDHATSASESVPEPEILINGGAWQHGLLLNRISAGLEHRPFLSITELGLSGDAFDALCTTVLATMFVDQIPANLPHLTGGETSVLLGRLTPGSPLAWQKLLQSMSAARPVQRTLRSAM